MSGVWHHDLESLEAISQDGDTRRIVLRMATLSQNGQLGAFLTELHADGELDPETKGMLSEIAADTSFLLAVEDYLHQTHRLH
jgi:hypothetical protein